MTDALVPDTVTIHVPGKVVGKGRPRLARRGPVSSMYTPEATANYESLVAMAGAQAMAGRPPIEGAVAVSMDIRITVPASWSKRKQAQALAGEVYPTTKPDIDNVEKSLFDGLNGITWRDDVQVVIVDKRKRYADTPGVEMVIRPMTPGQLTAPVIPPNLTDMNTHAVDHDGIVAAVLLQAAVDAAPGDIF